jgi:hypothetical protein
MESYPGELLVGVFPLIFCVDATLRKQNAEKQESPNIVEEERQGEHRVSTNSSVSNRSQFDKFLDAMAASLMEDSPSSSSVNSVKDSERGRETTVNNPMTNIFRVSDHHVVDSDEDDQVIFQSNANALGENSMAPGSLQQFHDASGRVQRPNPLSKINFSRIGTKRNHRRGGTSNRNKNASGFVTYEDRDAANIIIDPTFGASLQQGQSFFQRARIVSVSTRYGFPPSKDPTGKHNRVKDYLHESYNTNAGRSSASGTQAVSFSRLLSAIQKRPIDGILPSGWLEKHSAALPSVILLVLQINHDAGEQRQQDKVLLETVKNLHQSLAPKRLQSIAIKVVGLVQQGVSGIAADQWMQGMSERLTIIDESQNDGVVANMLPMEILLINVLELQPDYPYSGSALQQLHEVVRDASLAYYSTQTRRVKDKLLQIGSTLTFPVLLPLAIRYCFKVAIFYEFQWKQEKSLKYMIEAYLLLEVFYKFLLQQHEVKSQRRCAGNLSVEDQISENDNLPEISAIDSDPHEDTSQGVELALTMTSGPGSIKEDQDLIRLTMLDSTSDMIYQCRRVADWINFKILQSGLVSNVKGGLLAASSQWQRHAQAFCCPRRALVDSLKHPWLDWAFIARQYIVLGQLLERYPPRVPNKQSLLDEAMRRFVPWRTYEGATEALLKIILHINAVQGGFCEDNVHDVLKRYVGGINHDGFGPLFEEESNKPHLEEALRYAMKGISLFKTWLRNMREVEHGFISDPRAGVRLLYLAGGILFRMERFSEALPYVEEAADLCKGWRKLELAVSRILVECYRKVGKSSLNVFTANSKSKIVRACLMASRSENEFRNTMDFFADLCNDEDTGNIRLSQNDDCRMPFCFAILFPKSTHETAGNTATASIWLKSTLNYAVQVDSISLSCPVVDILVPKNDLLKARNANEGSNNGVIIQPHTEIELTTKIDLPEDLEVLLDDVASSGRSQSSSVAQASDAKIARPLASGITASAGCCFLPEDRYTRRTVPQKAQTRFRIGGKPLSFTGLKVLFSPIDGRAKIELNLENSKAQSDAAPKRTPFEEHNYVSSAWERSEDVPMNLGPRCLRILPPASNVRVTDITYPFTNGFAIEGTVNRIVLQLESAALEDFHDIKVLASCISSCQETRDNKQALLQGTNSIPRLPTLVRQDGCAMTSTSISYNLPAGWNTIQNCAGTLEVDGYFPIEFSRHSSSSIFALLDLYRPSPDARETTLPSWDAKSSADPVRSIEDTECSTNIFVSISYRKCRTSRAPPSRRRGRQKEAHEKESAANEFLSIDYTASVVWKAPMLAKIVDNSTSSPTSGKITLESQQFLSRCILEPLPEVVSLSAKIDRVVLDCFESDGEDCVVPPAHGDVLFDGQCSSGDVVVGGNSKMSFAWPANQTSRKMECIENGTKTTGILSVHWHPVPVELPDDVVVTMDDIEFAPFHGPLKLQSPAVLNLGIPRYLPEPSPIEVRLAKLPEQLQVAVSFEVTYTADNKTWLDQELEIHHPHVLREERVYNNAVIFGGQASCTISLAPFQSYSMSFVMVPIRVGQLTLPQISVWSKRYQSWVVRDDPTVRCECFVLP